MKKKLQKTIILNEIYLKLQINYTIILKNMMEKYRYFYIGSDQKIKICQKIILGMQKQIKLKKWVGTLRGMNYALKNIFEKFN